MNIRKNTLIFLGLILNLPVFGQSVKPNDMVSLVKNEIITFIDSTNAHAIKNGKYMVYTMKITYAHPDTFCFFMGCIENKYEYKYVNPTYVYFINNDIVLVDNLPSEINSQKWIQKLGINKIDTQNWKIVMNKLYDNTTGGIISINPGFVCCIENKNVYTRRYDNSDNMPTSIYDALYPNPKIKLIYSPPTPSKKHNKIRIKK